MPLPPGHLIHTLISFAVKDTQDDRRGLLYRGRCGSDQYYPGCDHLQLRSAVLPRRQADFASQRHLHVGSICRLSVSGRCGPPSHRPGKCEPRHGRDVARQFLPTRTASSLLLTGNPLIRQSQADSLPVLAFWTYNVTILIHLIQSDGMILEVCQRTDLLQMFREMLNAMQGERVTQSLLRRND